VPGWQLRGLRIERDALRPIDFANAASLSPGVQQHWGLERGYRLLRDQSDVPVQLRDRRELLRWELFCGEAELQFKRQLRDVL